MTIIYQFRVATTSLGGFMKLLAAWRGSVYKLLYKEFLIFAGLFAFISLIYRKALSDPQRLQFERVVIHCNNFTNLIPISFVLGFYVTIVVQRWWQQFQNVPWPDRTIFLMCTYLNGLEERARIMRRSVARYMMFGLILIMRAVSVAVMKRFPTLKEIVEAGYITKAEAYEYEGVKCQYLRFWVPLMWANNILARARHEGRIETEYGLRMVIEALADFRDKCSLCFVYDWITIPLVYTQVVTIAVHSFFAACLLGRQFLDPLKKYSGYDFDYYIPVFTFLQFLFYMGWLKVAEQMINPFGEDDDDYDINWLLDRHAAVAFALVDQCCGRHPPLIRDPHWNQEVMPELPYNPASESSRRPNFLGSTFNIAHMSSEDQKPIHLDVNGDRLRRRSHAAFGSVMSLFSQKSQNKYTSGSNDKLESIDRQLPGRFLPVPNNRLGYQPVPAYNQSFSDNQEEKTRRISFDVYPIFNSVADNRQRSISDTEAPATVTEDRVRKLSVPVGFTYFSEKEVPNMATSPKLPRFTVEPVREEDEETVGEDPVNDSTSIANPPPPARVRRTGQYVLNTQQIKVPTVSRPPVLSAIEEGHTVTSLSQILSSDGEDDVIHENASSDDDATHDHGMPSNLENKTEEEETKYSNSPPYSASPVSDLDLV